MQVKTYNEMLNVNMVDVVNNNNQELIFTSEDGTKFMFHHIQDCCENVYIEDVCGDLEDLKGIILEAKEVVENASGPGLNDSGTWTFYHFSTVKGSVTVRWLGESNGYYSESVDFTIIES